jgi:hypothetical protein
MEGLFSLLLFAALFYFMMRFGCGAHMVHDDRATADMAPIYVDQSGELLPGPVGELRVWLVSGVDLGAALQRFRSTTCAVGMG